MKRLLSAVQTHRALDRLYKAVLAQLPTDAPIGIIGVRTRGEILGRRIIDFIRREKPAVKVDFGILDITFYRDDLSRRHGAPLVKATEIDFDINDAWILLVDDVLQTGRSSRAALDALHDFGRPKVVRLAVLIDREERELPISADFVGQKMNIGPGQRVQVKLKETDGEEGVFLIPK